MSIMSNDQQGISSKLRFMDPQTLRQYGNMHKTNPYIFPLVFQESQNRQRLQMNQQMQMAGQQQPKVNEQALAQMAPPRAQPMPQRQGQGIVDLSAPNMETMADGGIAGYPDDDFVTRNQSVVMMAGGGHIPRYQGNPQDGSVVRARGPYDQPPASMTGDIPGFVAGTSIFQTQPSVDPEEPFLRRLLRERKEAVEAQRVQEARVRAMKGQPLSAEDQARIAKADTAKTAADTSAQDLAQFDAASNLYMTERAGKQAAAKPAPVVDNKAAPRADTTRQPRPDTRQETPRAPAVPEQTAAQRYAEMQKGLAPDRTKIDEGIASLSESMRKTAKGELEDFDKEVAERGVAFKGREERLAKREEGLGKRKDDLGSFALLEFGLGLLAEPGNFAAAVGRVGQRTATNYSAGLKDLRAAQEKMDDARDQIEEFRRNENNMTAKERRQFKNQINRTETDIEKLGLQAAEKMYGYGREDAKAIFTADTQERLTDKEIDAKRDIAAMQERGQSARSAAQIAATLNTPDRLVFNQLLKDNGNDAVKAAEALQKMKVEKFNVYDSYSKYLAGFAGKDPAMVGAPESITKYASRFAALTPPAPVDTNKPTRP
jgi:hypothetical protein